MSRSIALNLGTLGVCLISHLLSCGVSCAENYKNIFETLEGFHTTHETLDSTHEFLHSDAATGRHTSLRYNVTKCDSQRYHTLVDVERLYCHHSGHAEIQFKSQSSLSNFLEQVSPGTVLMSHHSLKCQSSGDHVLFRVQSIELHPEKECQVEVIGNELQPFEIFRHAEVEFATNMAHAPPSSQRKVESKCGNRANWYMPEFLSANPIHPNNDAGSFGPSQVMQHMSHPVNAMQSILRRSHSVGMSKLTESNLTDSVLGNLTNGEADIDQLSFAGSWKVPFPSDVLYIFASTPRMLCKECSIQLSPTIRFRLHIRDYQLVEFTLIMESVVYFSVVPYIDFDAMQKSFAKDLAKITLPSVLFTVGGVPVELQPNINLSTFLGVRANVKARVGFTVGVFGHLRGGIAYDQVSGFRSPSAAKFEAVPHDYDFRIGSRCRRYDGALLHDIANVEECAASCEQDANCKHFQFDHTERTCALSRECELLSSPDSVLSTFSYSPWVRPDPHPTLSAILYPAIMPELSLVINRIGGPNLALCAGTSVTVFALNTTTLCSVTSVNTEIDFLIGGSLYLRIGGHTLINREEYLNPIYTVTVPIQGAVKYCYDDIRRSFLPPKASPPEVPEPPPIFKVTQTKFPSSDSTWNKIIASTKFFGNALMSLFSVFDPTQRAAEQQSLNSTAIQPYLMNFWNPQLGSYPKVLQSESVNLMSSSSLLPDQSPKNVYSDQAFFSELKSSFLVEKVEDEFEIITSEQCEHQLPRMSQALSLGDSWMGLCESFPYRVEVRLIYIGGSSNQFSFVVSVFDGTTTQTSRSRYSFKEQKASETTKVILRRLSDTESHSNSSYIFFGSELSLRVVENDMLILDQAPIVLSACSDVLMRKKESLDYMEQGSVLHLGQTLDSGLTRLTLSSRGLAIETNYDKNDPHHLQYWEQNEGGIPLNDNSSNALWFYPKNVTTPDINRLYFDTEGKVRLLNSKGKTRYILNPPYALGGRYLVLNNCSLAIYRDLPFLKPLWEIRVAGCQESGLVNGHRASLRRLPRQNTNMLHLGQCAFSNLDIESRSQNSEQEPLDLKDLVARPSTDHMALCLHHDGNVVLTSRMTGDILWQSNTSGAGGNVLMRKENYIEIHHIDEAPERKSGRIWLSHHVSWMSHFPGLSINTGNIASTTMAKPMMPLMYTRYPFRDRFWMSVGDALYPGQTIISSRTMLIHQLDGNVVLYEKKTRRKLWSTNNVAENTTAFALQNDGTLALYASTEQNSSRVRKLFDAFPVANRRTGFRVKWLVLEDDCRLLARGLDAEGKISSQYLSNETCSSTEGLTHNSAEAFFHPNFAANLDTSGILESDEYLHYGETMFSTKTCTALQLLPSGTVYYSSLGLKRKILLNFTFTLPGGVPPIAIQANENLKNPTDIFAKNNVKQYAGSVETKNSTTRRLNSIKLGKSCVWLIEQQDRTQRELPLWQNAKTCPSFSVDIFSPPKKQSVPSQNLLPLPIQCALKSYRVGIFHANSTSVTPAGT